MLFLLGLSCFLRVGIVTGGQASCGQKQKTEDPNPFLLAVFLSNKLYNKLAV